MDKDESYASMLTRIGLAVDEFTPDPSEVTVEDAVKLAMAELYELRAYKIRQEIYKKYPETYGV